VDANDAIANLDLDSDPTHPQLVLAASEGDERASRALQNINHKQFAPRGGFDSRRLHHHFARFHWEFARTPPPFPPPPVFLQIE
jgi:hypothetical protein